MAKKYKILNSISYHFIVIMLGLVMIYPLLWMLMSSFKSNSEIFLNILSLLPKKWDAISNYKIACRSCWSISY